ncbi:MAG TPA: hypothetical protein VGC44_00315 [Longimicrobiales bacterium]
MRRIIAFVLLIAVLTSSCMSAPRTISSPRTFIPMNRPDRVWLTDKEGERMVVLRPRILPGDTLFARTMTGDEVWLPLGDIQRVQARQLDKQKTFLVVGGVAAVAGLFIAVAAGGGGGVDRHELDRPENSITLFRTR